ncbi:MAG: SDR family NAD(P)-dependent oxidoreductase [Acidimicrobiales bacterium]|jgi:NAD(P)-dependent dehydrogenase (short-subunit alcohol dehydrogenase family)
MSSGQAATAATGRRGLAVVTGGASGIGRAVALRLAAESWELALLDVDEDGLTETARLIGDIPGAADPARYAVDVTDAERVEAAVADIAGKADPIAALVSNAGVLTVIPVLDLPIEQWRRTLDINLTGSFICARAVAREMVRAGTSGRIVTVASVHSLAPGTNVADYDASKGGLLMLTRSLARELAPHGITVNAVGPGLILTNLAGGASQEYLDHIVPAIPLRRAGQPSDVAGVVAFLLGQDASYMTGSLLVVDGGMLLTADL